MQIILSFLIAYPAFSIVGLFFASIILFHFYLFRIRPLFIPKAEIAEIADNLIALYGPFAEQTAFIEEDRAWRYSDVYEQGKWRRVRRELWRRFEDGEWPADPV